VIPLASGYDENTSSVVSIVANLLKVFVVIRPGIRWIPIVLLSTRRADNWNCHTGERIEIHYLGRKSGLDHAANIWAPSNNIGH